MEWRARRSAAGIAAAVAGCAALAGCPLEATVGWECPAVVINEFSTKNQHWQVDIGSDDAEPDWVELFNPTEHEVDLSGFRLVQGSDFDTGSYPELVPPR